MTTINTTSPLRGDICPSWCGGHHNVARDEHPDDQGVFHEARDLERWTSRNGQKEISVGIQAFRHDFDTDWPPEVVAENVSPGFLSPLCLEAPDARRLAHALLRAADLADADINPNLDPEHATSIEVGGQS